MAFPDKESQGQKVLIKIFFQSTDHLIFPLVPSNLWVFLKRVDDQNAIPKASFNYNLLTLTIGYLLYRHKDARH